MKLVALIPGAYLVIAWLSDWFESRAVHILQYALLPDRWILWGYEHELFGAHVTVRAFFFILRLPSYEWRWDLRCQEYAWHQRVLTYYSGHGYGWRIDYRRCFDEDAIGRL
jgi:hypothetical protein